MSRLVRPSEMSFSLLVQRREKKKRTRHTSTCKLFLCVDEVFDFVRSLRDPPPKKRRRGRTKLTCRKKRGRLKHITFVNNISVVFSLGLQYFLRCAALGFHLSCTPALNVISLLLNINNVGLYTGLCSIIKVFLGLYISSK